MKEIKIKEKWLYEAMNRAMEKKDSIKMAFDVLNESLREATKLTNDLWFEMEKLYKLDPKRRYYYIKKTHSLQDTCTRNTEPDWVRKTV